MKIYTKKGDQGMTSLYGGKTVSKSSLRIEAYGTIDELNSWLGLIRDVQKDEERKQFLKKLQDNLFSIGSSLAADPDRKLPLPEIEKKLVELMETEIDKMDTQLPNLKNFIIPGGHTFVSYCHITRCVCRRAERIVTYLSEKEKTDPFIVIFLNRLSDYLFILARMMSKELSAEEIIWKS
ncbi:MAG: cob(I)yrinic acid a,c-diamide adenosyltransferase [Cytophagaceae bacterium]